MRSSALKIRHREPYKPLRISAYPSVGDQLDVLVKLAASLRDQGIVLPADVLAWIDQCEQVKRRHPKN